MCGIAAIFAYSPSAPPVDRGELINIRDRMFSRGPDAAGEWISADGRVGLGHRRLSILDLSENGRQPMFTADRQFGIVFNGEIYNYRDLRSQLEQKGYQFQSTSDTEVLLYLYAEHGESMVHQLRGMYGFAIWDEKKRGVFLARDPFGIKPLYYADDGKTVRVASQVKALLAGGHVDTSIEPAGHVGYLLWGYVPYPFTLYRGIKNLPAGSTLWVDQDGNHRQSTFCTVPQILAEAEASPPPKDRRESAERLRSALEDTVRHHLVADVPVGVFLSAGLDSTTLTALAARERGDLRTVTIGFEEFVGTPNDETVLAEKIARLYGTKHQTVWVSRADFHGKLERLLDAMDQPSIDGVNSYFVSFAAAQASLKVAWSGTGGDELFGGYPSFFQIPRMVKALGLSRFFQPVGRAFRIVSASFLKRVTSPRYASLLEYGGTYKGAYLLRRGLYMPWEIQEILDPEIARQGLRDLQPLARMEEMHEGLSNPWSKVMCLETCQYLRGQLLRDMDWAGMAHSLEIRVPLVDVGLYRLLAPLVVSNTPPTKQDFAHVVTPPLPDEILLRPKTGFGTPMRQWLRAESVNSPVKQRARNLRGWALDVYRQFVKADTLIRTAPSLREELQPKTG